MLKMNINYQTEFIIKHRVDTKSKSNNEGLNLEFELTGNVSVSESASPSDALVSFSFFDENYKQINLLW